MLGRFERSILGGGFADHNRARDALMTQQTNGNAGLAPAAVASDDGEALWWGGGLAVVKAGAADTGGLMTILEITEPPDAEAPLHVHHNEDEAFWILEGSAVFEVGDVTFDAHAGDYLFGPRDVPHRYTTGPQGCRMLFILTPGGFEGLVREMSEPAGSRTLPPPSAPDSDSGESPDMQQIAAMTGRYGCEILG